MFLFQIVQQLYRLDRLAILLQFSDVCHFRGNGMTAELQLFTTTALARSINIETHFDFPETTLLFVSESLGLPGKYKVFVLQK